jgi:transcriptional regulator with XRE-family HTH domain
MVMVRRLVPISDSLEPVRPRFMMEPLGTGTSDIEALSSFFCQIADRHWMLTVPLWNAVAAHASKVKLSRGHRNKRLTLRLMNGHGKVASSVVGLLRIESLLVNQLTLLPWRNILDPMAHDLLRPTRAWCPVCWSEDRDSGSRIYVRLLWVISAALVCPKHQVELQTVCRNCESPQEVLPRIPRLSICGECGADLIQQLDRRRLRTCDQHGKEIWMASSLGSLIKYTCASGVTIEADAFQTAVNTLAVRHFGGSVEGLADACGLSRRMIRQWSSGETKPYLTGLLELAYRTQIPPAAMLLEGVGLTDPNSWLKEKRPTFVARGKKLTKERILQIRRELRQAIKSRSPKTISVKKFARDLGTTYLVIKYHFPREYELLQKKGRLAELRSRKALMTKRIQQTIVAAHELAGHGIYPSDRALKERTGIIPSSLRRLEVKKVLRAVRLEFLAGAYSPRARRQDTEFRDSRVRP